MKKTRKITSIILTAVIVLLCLPFGAVAQETSAEKNIYEIQVLHELGILRKDASVYNMDANISRGEFAEIMFEFMGDRANYSNKPIEIYDVEEEYEYAQEISFMLENGIMKVDSSNRFRPLDKLTGKDMIEAFVAVLGYKPKAEVYGGGSVGYLRVMREIDLSTDSVKYNSAAVTYRDLISMLYQSLETALLEIKSLYNEKGETNYTYSNESEDTPLSKWHNSHVIYGLLTHIERGAADLSGTYPEEVVQIDGYSFELGEVEADQYIGYMVKAYYDKDSNVLKSVVPDVTENDIIIIEAKDIESFKDGVLKYYKGNKQMKINIPTSSNIVYNGVAVAYDKRESVFDISDGYVVVNNFSKGNVKMLTMITSYKTYIIGAKTIDKVIYDLMTSEKLMFDFENNKIEISDTEGKSVTYEELGINDIITVASSLGGERINIVRSKKTVNGTISHYNESNGEKFMTINGVKYQLTHSYANSGKELPGVGTDVTLYLDRSDRVANAVLSESAYYTYGFLKEGVVEDSVPFKKPFLKVRIFDGEAVKNFECDEDVKIDNYKTADGNEAMEALKKGTLTTRNWIYQPIRFRLNPEKSMVVAIDTAYRNIEAGESEDSLRYLHRGNDPWNLGSGSSTRLEAQAGYNFGQKLIAKNSSSFKRFTVPSSPDAEDEYFRNSVTWWGDGAFVVDGLTSRADSIAAEFIISYKSANSTAVETMYGFVKEISQTLNSDEVESYRISYVNSEGEEGSFCTKDNSVLTNAIKFGTTDKCSVEEGDFISFGVSGKDQIVEIKILYNANEKKWYPTADSEGSFGYNLVFHGYVLQRDEDIIRVGNVKPQTREEMLEAAARFISVAPAKFYIYEEDGRQKVTPATKTDLISYAQSSEACSEIVSGGYNGADRIIVIYK